jgi:glycosyltransferase involved in cell wall biosynthesis
MRNGSLEKGSLRGMRVCFIAGTLGQGGAEQQLYYILRCLKQAGCEVTLLSFTRGEYWEASIRKLGVAMHWVGKSSSKLIRLMNIIRAVHRLRPQVIQAQHFYVNLYAVAAARLTGCRAIGAIRGSVTGEIADIGGQLGRASVYLPTVIATNSRAAVRRLVNMGVSEKRLFFLPNVIDNSLFATGSPPEAQSFVILGVGRLVPPKRFDFFLHVLAALAKQRPIKGLIAGDGPLRVELESLAVRLGLLPGVVEFLGQLGDTSSCYGRAHVLLSTSDHEGTPNAILEAMAAGLPVIGTRVGGVPDLLGGGARGRLVDPGDIAGLVWATEELMNDASLRTSLANRARDYVQSEHSQTALQNHLTNLYSLTLAT